MKKELLRVSHLSLKNEFGYHVDQLSFDVYEQEIFGILALYRNKHSVLDKLNEFYDADITVFLKDQPIPLNMKAAAKAGIFLLSPLVSLTENLTVASNFCNISPAGKEDFLVKPAQVRRRTQFFLSEWGLSMMPDTLVSQLNTASRRQLELLRAIANGARLIVLENVFQTIPYPDQWKLIDMIRKANQKGIAFILIENNPHLLHQICSRIMVISKASNKGIYFPDDFNSSFLIKNLLSEMPDSGKMSLEPIQTAPSYELRITHRNQSNLIFPVYPGEFIGIINTSSISSYCDYDEILKGVLQINHPALLARKKDSHCIPYRSIKELQNDGIYFLENITSENTLFPNLSVQENLISYRLDYIKNRFGFFSQNAMKVICSESRYFKDPNTEKDHIQATTSSDRIKLNFERTELAHAKLLIWKLEESTLSLDTRSVLQEEIVHALTNNTSIICCSNYIPELVPYYSSIILSGPDGYRYYPNQSCPPYDEIFKL